MKTSLTLFGAAALALCACESTTPAQRYAQAQQVVAQAYGNKLSPSQQAALVTAIYQQAEATRATQQAQQAAIIQNGFNNAAQSIRDSAPSPSNYHSGAIFYPNGQTGTYSTNSYGGTVFNPDGSTTIISGH